MKFTCDKAALSEAVTSVSPAVSQKSTVLALECILLRCKGSVLSVIGYNLELGITKDLQIEGQEDGEIILNSRLFSEIIRQMPNGELSFATDEKLMTVIQSGGAKFTILGMNADEYPELPIIDQESSFSINGKTLRSMISETLFAISQESTTPVLTGALFEGKGGVLHLVSVDGKRLALRREPIDFAEDFRFVVPGRTLNELLKLIGRLASGDDDLVQLNVGSRHIIFECGGYQLISRLLEGEFINYNSAIPSDGKLRVRVNVRAFFDVVSRASIIINEKVKNPIRAVFGDGQIQVSCETSLGKVSDSIPADVTGDGLQIGFNNRFMLDALKASVSDEVILEMSTPLSPIKVLPLEGEHFVFLVMPMRLKDDH
ncbi:MAG: DNA polymerase III subunit beta [Oscillospiraceae bacterium]|jgi:DNA polymerase-3 subunit beta|nr:DNA polymerase III subunit beta [Oscillospiraceae bacterium]